MDAEELVAGAAVRPLSTLAVDEQIPSPSSGHSATMSRTRHREIKKRLLARNSRRYLSRRTIFAMAAERIDARDVLDPNAKTATALAARIVGHFVRWPDAWDDYLFQPVASGSAETIEVMADVPVQVEPEGAVFRMRRRGEVLRLQWQPPDGAPGAEDDQRTRFLAECVRPWGEDPGRGAAAVIAEKLTSKPPKPSLD